MRGWGAATYTASDKLNTLRDKLNTLRDKTHKSLKVGHMRLAQLLQTDREYCASLQTRISSITGVQTLMYTCKPCVKFHSRDFFDYLGF